MCYYVVADMAVMTKGTTTMTKIAFTSQEAFDAAAFNAGRADYKSDHVTIATFIAGRDGGYDVKAAERKFKLGAVTEWAMQHGKARTVADATAWADKCASQSKPPKDESKRNDTHRDADQHRAWSAAGMTISRLLRKAEVTEAAAPRKAAEPKPASNPAADNAAVIPAAPVALKVAAPKLATKADAAAFLADVATMMLRTLNESASSDALQGELGNLLRGTLTDMQEAAREAATLAG